MPRDANLMLGMPCLRDACDAGGLPVGCRWVAGGLPVGCRWVTCGMLAMLGMLGIRASLLLTCRHVGALPYLACLQLRNLGMPAVFGTRRDATEGYPGCLGDVTIRTPDMGLACKARVVRLCVLMKGRKHGCCSLNDSILRACVEGEETWLSVNSMMVRQQVSLILDNINTTICDAQLQ